MVGGIRGGLEAGRHVHMEAVTLSRIKTCIAVSSLLYCPTASGCYTSHPPGWSGQLVTYALRQSARPAMSGAGMFFRYK